MNAKTRMNSRKRPLNPRERWHPLAKLGVNYRSFGLNEGHFRRKSAWRKDLQMYGLKANSSAVPVRTYVAKRRAPREGLSASYYQRTTSVDAKNFIRKSTVKQSKTIRFRRRIAAMATIHHQIAVAVPVAKVYKAISTSEGIGTWWDKQTATETPDGLVLSHNPGPGHGEVQLRVVELVPNQRVEWECISMHPTTSPASAWTGTRFVFELTEGESPARRFLCPNAARATTVDFRQSGYDETSEFAGFNNLAWGMVLQNLKQVVESTPD
jgi:uncharacterized protein YndB with AHSA1/START domain